MEKWKGHYQFFPPTYVCLSVCLLKYVCQNILICLATFLLLLVCLSVFFHSYSQSILLLWLSSAEFQISNIRYLPFHSPHLPSPPSSPPPSFVPSFSYSHSSHLPIIHTISSSSLRPPLPTIFLLFFFFFLLFFLPSRPFRPS